MGQPNLAFSHRLVCLIVRENLCLGHAGDSLALTSTKRVRLGVTCTTSSRNWYRSVTLEPVPIGANPLTDSLHFLCNSFSVTPVPNNPAASSLLFRSCSSSRPGLTTHDSVIPHVRSLCHCTSVTVGLFLVLKDEERSLLCGVTACHLTNWSSDRSLSDKIPRTLPPLPMRAIPS